jgi:hypothetical protein
MITAGIPRQERSSENVDNKLRDVNLATSLILLCILEAEILMNNHNCLFAAGRTALRVIGVVT